MTLGVVVKGTASCCLCPWTKERGDELSLRKHLAAIHARVLVSAEEHKPKATGQASMRLVGPWWPGDVDWEV